MGGEKGLHRRRHPSRQVHTSNIIFENCHLMKTGLYNERHITLKIVSKAPGSIDNTRIGGVWVTSDAIAHVCLRHTFPQHLTSDFSKLQKSDCFDYNPNRTMSIFIHRDVVTHIIWATLTYQDVRIFSGVLGEDTRFEKMFDNEIGHGVGTCHFNATLVIKPTENSVKVG